METKLKEYAKDVWWFGVNAADPIRLIKSQVRVANGAFHVGEESFSLKNIERIMVVGGGKASAKMAAGIEEQLEPILDQTELFGRVVVPDGSQVPTRRIELVVGRRSHENLPTSAALSATESILSEIQLLDAKHDLCIALVSGGGSALLPAPTPPITLAEKIDTTKFLAGRGANIEELNHVRGAISRIKNGGLYRLCRAKTLIGLILSDVLDFPISCVASGPTMMQNNEDSRNSFASAQAVLDRYDSSRSSIPKHVVEQIDSENPNLVQPTCHLVNQMIGENQTALDAAVVAASKLGYSSDRTQINQGVTVQQISELLCNELVDRIQNGQPQCVVFGCEPTLALSSSPGKGGRMQQLVLQMIYSLKQSNNEVVKQARFCCLCAGTDGEDGPTDAAGAFLDNQVIDDIDFNELEEHLFANNAYPLLDRHQLLFKTGNTGTNVCDLVVMMIGEPT